MKCPYCGHPPRLHAGRNSRGTTPGACTAGPPDQPCACPGWAHWHVRGREWQLEMQMEQDRVDRAFGESMRTLYEPDD